MTILTSRYLNHVQSKIAVVLCSWCDSKMSYRMCLVQKGSAGEVTFDLCTSWLLTSEPPGCGGLGWKSPGLCEVTAGRGRPATTQRQKQMSDGSLLLKGFFFYNEPWRYQIREGGCLPAPAIAYDRLHLCLWGAKRKHFTPSYFIFFERFTRVMLRLSWASACKQREFLALALIVWC